jgi:hypothetical protein
LTHRNLKIDKGQDVMSPQLPIPPVEDALDHLIDAIRSTPKAVAAYGYDVFIPNVVREFAITRIQPHAPGSMRFEVDAMTETLSRSFLDAAWQLCRLGVLRLGVSETGRQSTQTGEGYSITAFGHEWIAKHESPAYIPTDPGRVASLLTSRQDLFGPVFVIRANDAALCYSAHAFYACCAMIGAAAESIVLAAGVQKLTEPTALKLYRGTHGRKSLTEKVLTNCPEYVAKEFRLHAGLIDLWRDQSSHASPAELGETEAFTNLRGLIKLAQFAAARWDHLTRPLP